MHHIIHILSHVFSKIREVSHSLLGSSHLEETLLIVQPTKTLLLIWTSCGCTRSFWHLQTQNVGSTCYFQTWTYTSVDLKSKTERERLYLQVNLNFTSVTLWVAFGVYLPRHPNYILYKALLITNQNVLSTLANSQLLQKVVRHLTSHVYQIICIHRRNVLAQSQIELNYLFAHSKVACDRCGLWAILLHIADRMLLVRFLSCIFCQSHIRQCSSPGPVSSTKWHRREFKLLRIWKYFDSVNTNLPLQSFQGLSTPSYKGKLCVT